MRSFPVLVTSFLLTVAAVEGAAETVASWLFDEPAGLYTSRPLESAAGIEAPLVLGLGGAVVPGRFGRALSSEPYPSGMIPSIGGVAVALLRSPVPAGRTQEPLSWREAQFMALRTRGKRDVRKEVSFPSVTATDLNLGDFAWTVESWFRLRDGAAGGVLLELGSGPRADNDVVTGPFTLGGSRLELSIKTAGLGYSLVRFADEQGRLISGFSVDECVYINFNFIQYRVEWLEGGMEVSTQASRAVRPVLRMRGTSNYALQSVD
jgi:hypothetical protein